MGGIFVGGIFVGGIFVGGIFVGGIFLEPCQPDTTTRNHCQFTLQTSTG